MQGVLREKAILAFGEPVNSPKECNALSEQIFAHTSRKVSPTTLRRFFGLLPSTSAFSNYVLDSISMYCGSEHYTDFCNKEFSSGDYGVPQRLELINEIEQLTAYTLNSIYRKSLPDFKLTIPRKDINKQLDAFMESEHIFYPVIAPGGYGKSTALAHWVKAWAGESLCLFSSASVFVSLLDPKIQGKKPLQFRLESLNSIIDIFLNDSGFGGQKFLIVIDALDEISAEADKLNMLVDFIFDVANRYSVQNRIKIVFSARESVWDTHLAMRFEKVKAENWFDQIDKVLESGYSNFFALSNSEIREIIGNYNRSQEVSLIYECIPWNIRELVRIPINLHYINLLFGRKASMEHLTQNAVLREFLKETVFRAEHAEQKEDLIWKLLELMGAGEEGTRISKSELKKQYPIHLKREKAYYQAYADLLEHGVLLEYREENKYGIYITSVGFRHLNFYYYLLALYMIRENGGLDFKLLKNLASGRKEEFLTANMLAIFYQIAFENEDIQTLERFCELPEPLLASLPVRLAVGNSFREMNTIRNILIIKYASHALGRIHFFERFVDTNYLFNNYAFRIKLYLKYARKDEQVLFGNCILFLSGFLEMNVDKCEHYSGIIDQVHPDEGVYPWPIGRKVSSHILHKYFIDNSEIQNLDEHIQTYTRIAYAYPGYLARGLVEFELYIMLALVLVQEFEVLDRLLSNVSSYYNRTTTTNAVAAILGNTQNSLPIFFLEYAEFKQGRYNKPELPQIWERAIDNFAATFDDYQYLILLNWFLCDYYFTMEENDRSISYFEAALELSRYAGYEFYTAFLLKNDPLKNEENMALADQMIADSGFNPERFIYQFGPSVLQ
jgi:hypothetical protein